MSEHLGKISFSEAPDVNGLTVILNAGNTPSILADVLGNRPAFGTPGRLFIDTTANTISRDTGTAWVAVGGSTTTEVAVADANVEATRTYYNGGTAALSSWIIHGFDGKGPYLRLLDGDNDPSYITFDVIGTGSSAAPQFRNQFGGKGAVGAGTNGFSWKVGGAEIASLDGGAFELPSGTTAQRATPAVAGMVRYNSELGALESYREVAWLQHTGILSKSTTPVVVTSTAGGALVSVSIPGGLLDSNRMLRIRCSGSVTLANRTWNPTIQYGGTTMWSDTTAAVNGTAGWTLDVTLSANNSATAQYVSGLFHLGAVLAVNTGATGDASSDEISSIAALSGTAAVNSATTQILTISTGTISGTFTNITAFYHTVEVI